MAFLKKGSPSKILKVAEVEKNEKEAALKIVVDREGKEDKVGGTD